jgi:disulfide oxidoreductase YuzD
MKRKHILFYLLTVLLLGCSQIHVKDIRARNASNLQQLRVGMSKQAVLEIMGSDTETVTEEVYYQGRLAGYRELEVSNPYKSEIKKVGDRTYEILYYYADIFGMRMGYWDASYRDRKVKDNFLTPLIFENDRLIGWGREFAEEKELIDEDEIDKTDWMLWSS